jgi:hypothetical protein
MNKECGVMAVLLKDLYGKGFDRRGMSGVMVVLSGDLVVLAA